MIAEKLLLHVLIIIAPVLIYSMIFENRRVGKSPYTIGILYSISGSLCLLCAYYDYGLYWDLRYIPLVLSFLYGGPVSGAIVFLSILITRIYLGGDALLFGFASVFLSTVTPFICTRFFIKLPKRKRMWSAILLGFWPEIIQLCVLFTHQFSQQENIIESNLVSFILIFGLIQVIGIGIAAWLHEAIIERGLVKQEIQRAEKLNTLGELAASIAHEVRNP
ncbi:MAG: LytS/YhcK type 5TM receptor domain-containing protein, partial [Heyndrickxia sp.]